MSLTPGVVTALSANPYHPETFVKIVFPDAFTLTLWTGERPFTLGGDTYQPTSAGGVALGTVSQISETSDLSAQPMLLTVSGLSTDILSELRDFTHQGSPVIVTEAQFDGANLVPDEYQIFVGVVDTMALAAGKTLAITLTCNGLLQVAFRGPDGRRRTQADQEAIMKGSGDVGLSFASRLKEQIPWGVSNSLAVRQGLSNIGN